MKIATLVILGGAALMALPAQAAAPKLSGTYAVMSFSQCTVGFDTVEDTYLRPGNVTGPGLKGINTLGSGTFEIAVGTMTFPAKAVSAGAASLT